MNTVVILVYICLWWNDDLFSPSYYIEIQLSDVIQMLFISCCHDASLLCHQNTDGSPRRGDPGHFPVDNFPFTANPSPRAEKFLWGSSLILELSLDKNIRVSISTYSAPQILPPHYSYLLMNNLL